MKPSSFQETIENQFDYICKQAMEDERKDYFKQLSRLAKHEVSFSEIGDYLVCHNRQLFNGFSDFYVEWHIYRD